MKRLTLSLLLLVISDLATAQQWETDLDAAVRLASTQNKNILLFFSVADACDTCRRLNNDIFQSVEFLEYAQENLVLVKLDFLNMSSETKAEKLLIVEKYNKDGFFPWVVVINKNEKVVGKAPIYDGQSPARYVNQISEIDKK